ncbi:hypothetical protein NM74_11755 [Aeromonas hydrophila]|uniref:hypothetical protein n=1 Tax=Aeromonas hydrophila TaxID=644 RepID=UPI0005385CCD|nr:hypothetical protein [Aeromonas hydrophila]KHA56407.1 hypothetical protein NM74_11755 [Aeromonas hydrophila]
MGNPKSLVFQLYKNWDSVEFLARASREWPTFDEETVLQLIGKSRRASDNDPEAAEILRSLCSSDVLQWLERTNTLQVNPLVQEFVLGLLREHELGLSAVLKARIEAIKLATAQIYDGIAPLNPDHLRQGSVKLANLLRQISQQLDQDRHAILELAEQAKSTDAAMPIEQRYRAVLEAYDQYVEPMNQMMDTGLGGNFYPYLEQAEQALDKAVEAMIIQGGLYTHQLQLRQVAYQVKELQRLGRAVAQHCAATLLPLREELREHNGLSAAISKLLGRVRKRGLSRGLALRNQTSALPVWRPERPRRASVGFEIRELMANALAYTPVQIIFPEAVPFDSSFLQPVDEAQLKQHLQESLPVDNLLIWLQLHCPEQSDATLLRLYHELVREPLWQANLLQESTTTDLQQVLVSYHPYRIQAS